MSLPADAGKIRVTRAGPLGYGGLLWLIALGLILRTYHYGRNPSMWHDEAGNILNVLGKSFHELLGPLYASATGPPLFFWLQKCVVLAFGDGTYSLRLVSFIASCAGLLVMAALARRLLKPAPAAATMLLVACSDRLLWHAVEARHYSTDFLIAAVVAFLLVATPTWAAHRRTLLFAALAPLVIFASLPGVFLCGGVFVALLPALHREGSWKGGLSAIGFGAIIAVSFAVLYFTIVRAQRTAAVDEYWVSLFPDWSHPGTVPLWFLTSTVSVMDYMTRPIGGILIVAAFLGAATWWREGRREIVLFAAVPVLLTVIAALFRAYPYTGARTIVFAMPGIALLIGAGIGGLPVWAGGSMPRRVVVVGIVALPLAAILLFALYRSGVVWARADTFGASAYVLQQRKSDEPVTANHREYEYYLRGLDGMFFPDMRLLQAQDPPARYWIMVTSNDPQFRARIAESVGASHILNRREFAGTTVLFVSRAAVGTDAR